MTVVNWGAQDATNSALIVTNVPPRGHKHAAHHTVQNHPTSTLSCSSTVALLQVCGIIPLSQRHGCGELLWVGSSRVSWTDTTPFIANETLLTV